MKKILSLIICFVMAFICAVPAHASERFKSFGAYKHVYIIGIDGAGRFIKDADTPNFDRIFENGAVDYTARAEMLTISAQNWGSILTGVSYLKHGMSNESTDIEEKTSQNQYPTIFTYARSAFPDAELASFVNWSNINRIIENDIGVTEATSPKDGLLTNMICDYFNAGNAPTLFFVQFDSVDGAGHTYGSKSDEFLNQIETVDGYIGRIYDTIKSKGQLDDSLFIVVSDHGHTAEGGHGGVTMRETNVTVAVSGKGIVKGGKMDLITRNRDVAAIALHALGIKRPSYMTSRIPSHVFYDVAGQFRPIFKDWDDTVKSTKAWFKTIRTMFD